VRGWGAVVLFCCRSADNIGRPSEEAYKTPQRRMGISVVKEEVEIATNYVGDRWANTPRIDLEAWVEDYRRMS
jgi:hypothetical protein